MTGKEITITKILYPNTTHLPEKSSKISGDPLNWWPQDTSTVSPTTSRHIPMPAEHCSTPLAEEFCHKDAQHHPDGEEKEILYQK